MKDITIIIPLHKFNDKIKSLLENALKSIQKNQETYTFGKLKDTLMSQVQEEQPEEEPTPTPETTDFDAPKDSFKANQSLKDKIKELGFYD